MEAVKHFISSFNSLVFILFMVLYAYQVFFVLAVLFKKRKEARRRENVTRHKYAFLIAARNEAAVVGQLIESIRRQNYPAELIHIFVVADNCTDDTAAVARAAGAVVYERNNPDVIGKGYALDFGLKNIERDFGHEKIEGVFVFDADNVLTKDYVETMNEVFDRGYPVVTSYRNSKNYGTNWLTAGYSLWFLRESRYNII